MADQIKVDMIVKALSEGFEGVTSEMGKVEDSFGKVAVAQELANQKNVAYKQGVQQLTQGVKDGTITMEDAAQGAQRLGDELGIGAEKAQKTGTSWTELASKMSVAKEVLGTVAAGFKAVYDIAKEGAAIERTSETFDALSASINGTADSLLGKLQTATGGAVSNLELMSSANRFMAMGLADTEDSAAKLAQTAVTLGQAMGDEAGPSMENFALLLANQSIPRLDSFGISSGVVRERIAELTAGVDGLDKETAFMTAVMEQADATMGKIGQTGGATADNFTRLSVSGQNLTDSLKVLASNALDPVAESLANTADGATDAMGALDNGRSAWTNFLTILQEIDPEMKLVTSRYVDQQKANEDNTAAMEAANAVYRDSIEVQENFAESLGEGEKTAYQHTAAMVASEAAAIEAAHAYDLGADALGGITDRADLFAVAQQNVNSIIGESVDRFGEFDGAMGEMMSNLDSLLEDAALAQEVQDISSAFDEWAGSINAVSEASAVSTKESGDAKEEAQAQAQAISELKDSFASGAISFADYKQGIADLTAVEQEYIAISTSTKDSLLERDIALGKVTTSEINATTAAIEGKDALLLVKDALTQSGDAAAVAGDQIAATGSIISGLQDKTVTVNFVSNTSGFNAPDASSLLNSGGGVTTGGDVFGHHGLDMTVPPGFSEPSRPFMIGATSGEEVVITPKGQGRGGGGLTIESLVVNGSAGMDENMLADVVAQRIAAKFRAASAGMGAS